MGFEQNYRGLFLLLGFPECLLDITEIMTICPNDMPVKCSQFSSQWLKGHELVCGTCLLLPVHIHKSNKVSKLVFACSHCGFPDASLVQLAVSEAGINLVRAFVALHCQGKPDSSKESLAQ